MPGIDLGTMGSYTPVVTDLNTSLVSQGSSGLDDSFHSSRVHLSSTPIRLGTPRTSAEEHQAISARHRNPSASPVSTKSTPSRPTKNTETNVRFINTHAQRIARDQILRSRPIFYYNASKNGIETSEDTLKEADMQRVMYLMDREVLVMDIKQPKDSPFSKDILIRMVCDKLVDPERWGEVTSLRSRKHISFKPTSNFKTMHSEMIKQKNLSYASFPDTPEGWRILEDHLLMAHAQQVAADNRISEQLQQSDGNDDDNDDIFGIQLSQDTGELLPQEPLSLPLLSQSPNAYNSQI